MTELDQYARSVGYEGLADLAMFEQDFGAAIDVLEDAIASELDQNATHGAALKSALMAEAQIATKAERAARESLELALAHAAGDSAVLVSAAISLIELGEFDRAESIADDLSQSTSNIQHAYGKTIGARAALGEGNPTLALMLADEAIGLADLWLARYARAQILLSLNRPKAMTEFEVCRERTGEAVAVAATRGSWLRGSTAALNCGTCPP